MKMTKLAIASSIALLSMGAAHAVEATPLENELGALLASIVISGPITTTTTVNPAIGTPGATDYVPATTVTTSTLVPEIAVLSGAVNTAALNGSIDISGTNVSLSSMAADVSAKAEAIATNSTATAYAIAGAKLSTTVIGAMNSATVDVMSKLTEKSDATTSALGLANLSSSGGDIGVTTQDFGVGQLGLATLGSEILSATNGSVTTAGYQPAAVGSDPVPQVIDAATLQLDLAGLTSATSTDAMYKVSELQSMNVFNTAINVAALDASIKVTAAVDPNAWFLNPQTGVVNLSNIEMSTTNIGAMNSSLTRLGVNLAK
jgi:hypothetical protein